MPVPETVTLGTNDSKNSVFFMRELSSEKPFLRTGLDEGTKSTLRFKVWLPVALTLFSILSVVIPYKYHSACVVFTGRLSAFPLLL